MVSGGANHSGYEDTLVRCTPPDLEREEQQRDALSDDNAPQDRSGPSVDAGNLPHGYMLGSYRVVKKLGQGGMGAVYVVELTPTKTPHACKVILANLAQDDDVQRRFLREARAALRLGHPHIVAAQYFGHTPDGLAYFVSELLKGEDLKDRLKSGPLSVNDAIEVGIAVCDALAAAHAKGIVHRDIKPSNVFLAQEHDREVVKVLDFGLAKFVSDEERHTLSGEALGTPVYMSPEQGYGDAIDARADIYSLGVMLYEILCGQPPFRADRPLSLLMKHAQEPARWPEGPLAERASPQLRRVVLKTLQKRPEDRFATADELRAALISEQSAQRAEGERSPVGPASPDRASVNTAASAPPVGPQTLSPWPRRLALAGAFAGLIAATWAVVAQTSPLPAIEATPPAVAAVEDPSKPNPSPAKRHLWQIDTRPSGADVYVNDTLQGRAPIVVHWPEATPMHVRIQRKGYAVAKETFHPDAAGGVVIPLKKVRAERGRRPGSTLVDGIIEKR